MHAKDFVCFHCRARFPASKVIFECPKCGGSLDIEYDYSEIRRSILKEEFKSQKICHWKYWPFFPITDLGKIVSLQEGGTPLLEVKGKPGWKLKCEGVNPTGSFKDRGSSVEITKALELGVKEVACASTGNMGASLSAYSSRAGIKAMIFVPSFAEKNKLLQMKYYGAEVKGVRGSYEDALNATRELRKKTGIYLAGDYAFRGEGQKSVGFEVMEQFGWQAPEQIVCPIGNGTLIYAVFKACLELNKTGLAKKIPAIVGVQAKTCAPVVKAFEENSEIVPLKNPKTIATAICCGNPVDGLQALYALRNSGGEAIAVSEKEIIESKRLLGLQGIYSEFSGAVAFAGAKNLGLKGKTAIVVSGHGLKDSV